MKLSLATKIFLGFSVVLTVFAVIPIFNFVRLKTVRQHLDLLNNTYRLYERANAIKNTQTWVQSRIDGALKFDDVDGPAKQQSLLRNAKRQFSRTIARRLAEARTGLTRLDSSRFSVVDRRLVENLEKRFERIEREAAKFDEALGLVIESIDLYTERLYTAVDDLAKAANLKEPLSRLNNEVFALQRILKRQITSRIRAIERNENSAVGIILWLTIVAGLVGIIVTALSLIALRPIRRLAQAARRISKGDFSAIVDVSSGDEFGFLASEFNRMSRSLQQRESEFVTQQEQMATINRKLRQSSIDLKLMRLYNENIIRSMHNGVLVADSQGLVTTLNPAAQDLWMLDSDQTVGTRLENLPIKQSLSQLLNNWDRVLRNKERMVFEAVEFTLADRGQVLVDLYVSPLLGTDGNTHGVLLVGEDVTEKVRTKEALLHSERLATIGRMSALVAHEIRNPLSSIGLNTELLQEIIEDDDQESKTEAPAIIGSISREIERLVEVTDEYLRFARLPKPNLQKENVNEILQDLLQFMKPEIEDSQVELASEIQSEPIVVSADEAQLRQAFLNLLKNSAESMPDGGKLTVASQTKDSKVQIRIVDTGVGIEVESIDRIFDPFFSTREGGTGLGLSLTNQIIVEHGGSIQCFSTPGLGTEFLIELPLEGRETGLD